MVSFNLNSLKDESNTEGGRSVQKDFIGKEALLKQKHEGVKQRLCMFELEDIDPDKDIWPWGNEPIYRNGQFVGTVTSSGYVGLADASQPLLMFTLQYEKPCISNGSFRATNHHQNIDSMPRPTLYSYSPYCAFQYFPFNTNVTN